MSNRDDELAPQYAADLHRQGEVVTAAAPKRKRKRWVSNLIGLMFVGLVVGAAIIAVMRLANDPAQASITAATLKKSIAPTPTPNGELNGLFMDMSYPGVFNQVARVKSDVNGVEEYTLGSSVNYRREITVDVKSLPSGLPNDDAGYRLRELQSGLYTPSTQAVGSEKVYVMKKNDGTEDAFFWPHAGRMLIVAITSTEPTDQVDSFLADILPTVRWK